jgi:hypothetical protein
MFQHIIRLPVHQILFQHFFFRKNSRCKCVRTVKETSLPLWCRSEIFFEASDHVVSHQVNHVICFSGENSGANEACGDGALSGPQRI